MEIIKIKINKILKKEIEMKIPYQCGNALIDLYGILVVNKCDIFEIELLYFGIPCSYKIKFLTEKDRDIELDLLQKKLRNLYQKDFSNKGKRYE